MNKKQWNILRLMLMAIISYLQAIIAMQLGDVDVSQRSFDKAGEILVQAFAEEELDV